jgi:hypothetical protein
VAELAVVVPHALAVRAGPTALDEILAELDSGDEAVSRTTAAGRGR